MSEHLAGPILAIMAIGGIGFLGVLLAVLLIDKITKWWMR